MLALPFLLGICLPSLWILLFPLHALALIFLSLAKVLWTGGSVFFFLARVAPACLPTTFSVALRPFFSFQQAYYVQVSLLEPAPFCKFFAGFGSTIKSAIPLLFSFYMTLVLSSSFCPLPIFLFTSNFVPDLAGTVFSLLLFYQATDGSPDTCFSLGTTAILLSSYLSGVGRIENLSCSASGHSSQDTSHLILGCPATDSLRRSLFGNSLSLYDLWSRPWGSGRLLGLHVLPPCSRPSEGVM